MTLVVSMTPPAKRGARGPTPRSLYDRLVARLVEGPVPAHAPELGPCLIFTGAKRSGYGQIREGVGGSRLLQVHRVAYAFHTGEPLSDDVEVCHRCDNPPCARGSHLFAGTHADNMADASSKGRLRAQARPESTARGVAVHCAKLTDDMVIEMRSLRRRGWSQKRLGERYGLSQQGISAVLNGKSWRHV